MQSQERRQTGNQTLIAKYEKAINEKDKDIVSQKEIINKYSILLITRTSKGPMKMVRVNECSSYPG